MNNKPLGIEKRFWRHVSKTDTCWIWNGQINQNGYGIIANKKAHRVSWEIHNGSIPLDMRVLHKCDIRKCVNPDHLRLGTQQDNINDMFSKGRANKAKGQRVGGCKLTEEKVIEIRHSNSQPLELSKMYNVSLSTIYNIKNGYSWRWLANSIISDNI